MNPTAANTNQDATKLPHAGIVRAAQDISKINDPTILAAMIEKNQAALTEGWAELDRLTARLEALNLREKSIIKKDLQSAPPLGKSVTAISPPA